MCREKKRVAIIGGGIAGIAAADALGADFDITIFEKNISLGGNIDTHIVKDETGKNLFIDTGFISFNRLNYPHFISFLNKLNIPIKKSSMSYGVQNKHQRVNASGSNYALAVLWSFSPFTSAFWVFIRDILKFWWVAQFKFSTITYDMSLKQFSQKFKFSSTFHTHYLQSVAAGQWSQSLLSAGDFTARRVLNFLRNHNLVSPFGRSKCLFVPGGYHQYLDAAVTPKNIKVKLKSRVSEVSTKNGQAYLIANGKKQEFDHIILACEADIALKLLSEPSPIQQDLLSALPYKINNGFLHTDSSILPENKKHWATQMMQINTAGDKSCYTIWLNKILCLKTKTNYFMTLNPWQEINAESIIAPLSYRHLVLTPRGLAAQKRLDELNEDSSILFAGSYWNYFHEDAVVSAQRVAAIISARNHV